MSQRPNLFGARQEFKSPAGHAIFYSLARLDAAGPGAIARLPFSIKVLLESLLRNCDGRLVTEENVRNLAAWSPAQKAPRELPFRPARVILQDFTGVPAV